jgi:anti-sigma regulatory factor (Ser/Thr protein kinase)
MLADADIAVVIEVPATSATVSAAAEAVPHLRRSARRAAERWGLDPEAVDAVGVVVNEYATNAVQHSGTGVIGMQLRLGAGGVRIHVWDTGRWLRPRRPPTDSEAEHGRGRSIVRHLSVASGVCRKRGGSHAWALIACASLTSPPAPDP